MTQTSSPTYYSRRLVAYVQELWRRREFVWFLALGNFKGRNASTALGLFWWVLNPVLLSLVYWFVFGFFLGTRDIIYLMSGMFAFHFTSQALTGGANAVLQNSKLLTNLKFPRLILPLANLLEALMGFVVSLGVLLVAQAVITGVDGDRAFYVPTMSLLLLVVIIPIQFIFNLGLSSVAARLAVPFRDINNFIPYLNRIWLYLSPIIWPLSMLESEDAQQLAQVAEWNPMFSFIAVYRSALIGYDFELSMLINSGLWAIAFGVIGVGMFVRYEGNIARHL